MKKIFKKINPIFTFILGIIITAGTVFAATNLFAIDISFASKKGLVSTNVQDAIDEIYEKVNNSTNCPEGYTCTKTPICKRATTLHTEECANTSPGSCSSHTNTSTTVTFGSLGNTGTLNTGDAFDCDVNGDGTYDPNTERFYYVSDLWKKPYDETDDDFDSNTAVLIYYTNTKNGSPSLEGVSYITQADFENEVENKLNFQYEITFHGPVTGAKALPTTSQWSKVSLKNSKRQMYTSGGSKNWTTYDYSNGYTSYPLAKFDYGNKAARLINSMEIEEGCYDENLGTDGNDYSLSKCLFLFENTYYTNANNPTKNIYFENVSGGSSNSINSTYWYYTYTGASNNSASNVGIRPAIEVSKEYMQY